MWPLLLCLLACLGSASLRLMLVEASPSARPVADAAAALGGVQSANLRASLWCRPCGRRKPWETTCQIGHTCSSSGAYPRSGSSPPGATPILNSRATSSESNDDWLHVRLNGRTGWIRPQEGFTAIGLYFAP